jgi:hypothetical protein
MGNSYRVRTEIGKDKHLKVNLNQDYEFLDILSFKIRQSELYIRNCSDYGVIVGRVFANSGFGIPNAKINVFIPLTDQDATDPIISTLYPYRDLETLNEDGYRYNLLPYVPSYPGHAATGTFPDRKDVLNNSTVAEIYDKYYKFTVRTNQSGDFMIFGAPVGNHKIFMDLDLSDIGDFSLTPQDLIRMGRGTKEQFDGFRFKRSSDLGSLPQIVSLAREVFVSPLWGENDVCQIGITRQDFDLTTDANIEIKPTAVFMGSIFSTIDKHKVKKNCKIKRNAGELCSLITGPGEILGIRQTINTDSNGLPILEQADLPNNGRLIDDNGTWMFDVPMNMDYVTTNEFGETILSNDPNVGVPTTAKYRFKIKWSQSKNLNEETRRAYFLVPNLREYGSGNNNDPDTQNSYAFDLDWSGYTIQSDKNAIQDFIDCKDKFYKFDYNKVYTVTSFIDNFKKQRPANRFLAIKEITDPRCDSENLKFPVNDGVMNRNLLTFVFNILLIVTQPLMFAIIILFNILATIWPVIKFIINFVLGVIMLLVYGICSLIRSLSRLFGGRGPTCTKPRWDTLKGNPFKDIRLPAMSYPDCEVCDSNLESKTASEPEGSPQQQQRGNGGGIVAALGSTYSWSGLVPLVPQGTPPNPKTQFGENSADQEAVQSLFAGTQGRGCGQGSQASSYNPNAEPERQINNFTYNLPIAEKINLLNVRSMYYEDYTRAKITIEPTINIPTTTYHYDNLMVLILEDGNLDNFKSGQLLSFVDRKFSSDPNLTGASYVNTAGTNSITGVTTSLPNNVTVTYGNPNYPNRDQTISVNYKLPTTKVVNNITEPYDIIDDIYKFPIDIEYFQVITATTLESFYNLSNTDINVIKQRKNGLNHILRGTYYSIFQMTENEIVLEDLSGCDDIGTRFYNVAHWYFGGNGNTNGFDTQYGWGAPHYSVQQYFPFAALENFKQKNIVFIQRGVDPNSPKYKTRVDLSKFYDWSEGTIQVEGDYKINVPIQSEILNKRPCSTFKKNLFNGNNAPDTSSGQYSFFKSNFYQPSTSPDFSGFTTNAVRFYSHLDADNLNYTIGLNCDPGLNIASNPTLADITDLVENGNSVVSKPASRNISQFISTNNNFPSFSYITSTNSIEDYTRTFIYDKFRGYSTNNPPNLQSGEWWYTKQNDKQGNCESDFDYGWTIAGVPVPSTTNLRIDGGSYAHQSLWLNVITRSGPDFLLPSQFGIYMSPIFSTADTIDISSNISNPSNTRTVLRSDRLPSSSNFYIEDNERIFTENGNNKFMWQQNMNLDIQLISDEGESESLGYNSYGDQIDSDSDFTDQPTSFQNLLGSFNCEGLVGLRCYESDPSTGFIKINCQDKEDYVQRGAYIFVRNPPLGIGQDFKNLAEWVSRMRITFALCQGVLSEVFMNNWVNGALFMYPIQQELIFNSQNKVSKATICDNLIMRHNNTNTFYYKSTPYRNGRFRPKNLFSSEGSNRTQILHPTTITNLGPKSPLLNLSSQSGNFLGYYIDQLPYTSFSDTSELINFFALSRMLNNSFLQNLFGGNKGGINEMFSRPLKKVDGDYAQLSSINSQLGVVKFDEDSYQVQGDPSNLTSPIRLFASRQNPLIGVFFSATTGNLQETDYVSPGRIVLRSINPSPTCPNVSINYGFKSQEVPHYKWEIVSNNNNTIFGDQKNDWATSSSDIFQINYQSMDRYGTYYFKSQEAGQSPSNDIMERNYIWNYDSNSKILEEDVFPKINTRIVVGAPNYFYFGLKNGKTSLNRFFTEYLNIELND